MAVGNSIVMQKKKQKKHLKEIVGVVYEVNVQASKSIYNSY